MVDAPGDIGRWNWVDVVWLSDCLQVNSCGRLVSDYCGPNDGDVPFLATVLETVVAGGRYAIKRSPVAVFQNRRPVCLSD